MKEQLANTGMNSFPPDVGRALWVLDDARQRTWRVVKAIAPEVIDWQPPHSGNSVGTLLYHLAAIEMDWLYTEVMESKMPDRVWGSFPYPVRDAAGRLTVVRGVSLDDHLRRLDSTRKLLLNTFHHLTLDDFRRPRVLEKYDVTPEWVLHHLGQHEAEHRGEMLTVRAMAEAALGLSNAPA
jgi:uncharacterized damage-inducible protein DinB